MEKKRIEVKLSSQKSILGVICCLTFVILSFLILTEDFKDDNSKQFLKSIIGYSGVIFFGIGGLAILFKGFKSTPGLIIDDVGILDISSGQQVEWTNIKGIKVKKVAFTKFISFYLNDPESQIRKTKGLRRMFMLLNNKLAGTPTSISNVDLDIKFDDLLKLIDTQLNLRMDKNSS